MILCLALWFTAAQGQAQPAVPALLKLAPYPRRVVRMPGAFRLGLDTNIVFSDSYSEDRFAAEQLMEETLTDLGERLELGPKPARQAITLRRLKDPVAPDDFGQGYRLEVTPKAITISAETGHGIFYGVQTLKQLLRADRRGRLIPCCRITDWPTLKYRGWQHDISRGPIPTFDFLMKEVRTLSEFKLNMMTLYTEHVFKFKKHPTIAPPDGITADDVAELCAYAKQFHVEVVGNFQSFGHFANILKVPGYENLAETPRVLSPAKEESYRFLDDVYSEIAPAYASPLFDINCDEVSGLGQGPSKDLVKQIGVGGVYARHINRIAALLHKYGKTPMMWGDVALHYPDIVPQLPKDLIVLPWAYDPRPSFDSMIAPFTRYGLQFMVCPGVSCWSQIWPDFDRATVNISNFIRDGAKAGAMGSLNTSWDDDGMNFFDDNWYEFAWGAECSWRPALPTKKLDADGIRALRLANFNRAFASVFFGLDDTQVTDGMIALAQLRSNPICGGLRDASLFRDPVTAGGRLSSADIPAYLSQTADLFNTFKLAKLKATHNAPALDYALFASREAAFLGDSLAAVKSMETFDMAPMQNLPKEIRSIRDAYVELWQRENRPWWLDKNIAKFDALADRVGKLTK